MKQLSLIILVFSFALGCSKQSSYEPKSSPTTVTGSPTNPSVPTPNNSNDVTKPSPIDDQSEIVSGMYSGEIVLLDKTKPHVKLDVYLSEADLDQPGDSPALRQRMLGTFIVDGEGGPFTFNTATYDLDTNLVDMRYYRNYASNNTNGSAGVGTNTLNSGNPSLRLYGSKLSGGVIQGTVTSGIRGALGKFSMRKVSKDAELVSLVSKDKYVGKWVGNWNFDTGTVNPISLEIRSSPFPSGNPADSELDFTPGKIGTVSFLSGIDQYSFTYAYIDYFRKYVRISTVQMGTTLTFSGVINGDTISGDTDSTLRGHTGKFVLKKVKGK